MPRVEGPVRFCQPCPANARKSKCPKPAFPVLALVLFSVLSFVHPSYALTYRVRRGDTLDRIARRYKVSVKTLKRENGLSTSRLRPGRKLRILEARRGRRFFRKIKNKRDRRLIYARKIRHARYERHGLRHHIKYKKHVRRYARRRDGHGTKPVAAGSVCPSDGGPVAKDGAGASSSGAAQKGTLESKKKRDEATDAASSVSGAEIAGVSSTAGTAFMNATTSAIFNSILEEAARDKKEAMQDHSRSVTAYKDRYHRVRRGETLFSIARRYGTTVKKLKRLNGMRSVRLRVGRKLLVDRKVCSLTTAGEYRVEKGDTFYKIARKFHLDAEKLMDINEMDSEDLRPGQVITLTSGGGSRAAEADTRVSAPQIESRIKELQDSKTLRQLSIKDRLMLFAKLMLNIPYRFGGTTFYGIDCSALVQKVFRFLNISLPRTARQQYKEGVPVSLDDLAIGDLVFFRTYASFPSHVGIYIGKNLFIHASSGGHRVEIGSLTTPYFMKRLIGAKRLLTGGGELPNPGSGK